MSDVTHTRIAEILAPAGVTFTPHYAGERKNALDGSRPMDEWRCVFQQGERSVEFEYFTGLGLRKMPPWGPRVQGYDGGPAPRPGTWLHEQWAKQAEPQDPHPADLLHSLILDSCAADQSFAAWCDEFGYDTDSRKAFATYEAGQTNADKLRGFFTRETLESLTHALQDY